MSVSPHTGTLVLTRFRTFGCVAAIAASSMTTEMLRGMDVRSAAGITDEQVAVALGGLPPSKLHCSVLAEDAIHQAIRSFRAHVAAATVGPYRRQEAGP